MEAVVWGAVVIAALKFANEKKPDLIARAKVCDSLKDFYGNDRMTQRHFNWCLEHGAEDMMGYFGYELPSREKPNLNQKQLE